MKRVLMGSPIRQTPAILEQFLLSLTELTQSSTMVDYIFVDDNVETLSSQMLSDFCETTGRGVIIRPAIQTNEEYQRNEFTHYWKESQIWKVAAMKDDIIERARNAEYDGLFLVDSDLVLHPQTLEQLIQADKPIVSCIFWTSWQPDTLEMPQVWLQDEYTQYRRDRREEVEGQEQFLRMKRFFAQLRVPGLYEVGGLGACTWISKQALQAGVSFAEIKSISFWGEDRHFCIRADALGLGMFVETTYPAYHIYRESDLAGVAAYKQLCLKPDHSSLFAGSIKELNAEQLFHNAACMRNYLYEEAALEYYLGFLETGEGEQEQRVEAIVYAADCYNLLGKPIQSKNILETYVNRIPSAEIYCKLAFMIMNLEQWEEAILLYKQAIKLARPADLSASPDPSAWTWQPHLQLCVCYDRLGQHLRAMEHNEIGLSYDPHHPSMLLNKQYLTGVLNQS
ncbi:tetratricopeptide repeat protein [Paenibacillus periandrae]|uniref:tetratricopeptide repeat protein n=1 Tax=Paenibacillus periandrae TaxID=1761741 RepID=UPI001F09C78B|nr:tetratricopeptide repeat protein [Paenibacillus periandrae]